MPLTSNGWMRSPRSSSLKIVGHSPSRVEGLDKVTGRARYVDDISIEGMLFGRTIRSSVARGKLRSTRFLGDREGFTIVDHRDIPGHNVVAAIVDDQPCLVESAIEHAEEPILLLAHRDREALLRAHVELDIETATPEFDPLHSKTVFKHVRIEKGDIEAALADASHVIEGEYRTGAQEQLYIETNGMIDRRRVRGQRIAEGVRARRSWLVRGSRRNREGDRAAVRR